MPVSGLKKLIDSVDIISVERAMNIDTISSVNPPPDPRPAVEPVELPVINLDEIKSIIYLGVRGQMLPGVAENHRVDTFA
jgi:hypothetical protein